ncbi:hypothetical protein FLP41_15910 [Paracoccus marcusii]|nr:hypothetical protein FLP41_15910 [Paracoccus marcusii]
MDAFSETHAVSLSSAAAALITLAVAVWITLAAYRQPGAASNH